jgi:hypothetical protein
MREGRKPWRLAADELVEDGGLAAETCVGFNSLFVGFIPTITTFSVVINGH